MKAIKKFAAIILSMAMMLILAIPTAVSAAVEDDGTITISNAVAGHTYTIYRILDGDISSDGSSFSYTTNEKWNTFIIECGLFDGVAANSAAGTIVTLKVGESAATVASAVKSYLAANNVAADGTATANSDTVEFTGLQYGYYYVETTVGSVAILNNVNSSTEINEKNAAPTLTKQTYDDYDEIPGDVSTTTKGGKVYYTITINIPAPGATDVSLFDVMESGLTYNGDAAVTGATVNTDYKIRTTANGFQIDFADTYTNAAKTITVTYTATLADDAKDYVSTDATTNYKNLAYLKYGDYNVDNKSDDSENPDQPDGWKDPEDSVDPEDPDTVPDEPGTSTPDVTETRTFDFGIDKIDGTTNAKLEGIGFTLAGNGGPYDGTTDATGAITFAGLPAGTYTLEESDTTTTDNVEYNKGANITVEITEAGVITFDGTSEDNDIITIKNYRGTVLPETGATGTIIFTLIGAALIGVTGVLMITRKKMSVYEG